MLVAGSETRDYTKDVADKVCVFLIILSVRRTCQIRIPTQSPKMLSYFLLDLRCQSEESAQP
jgi:hypothetical protein